MKFNLNRTHTGMNANEHLNLASQFSFIYSHVSMNMCQQVDLWQ